MGTFFIPSLIPLVTFLILFVFLILDLRLEKTRIKKVKEDIQNLANTALEMTPEEFLQTRNSCYGGRGHPKISATMDFAGVYILFNKTKNMYYVGQGQKVLNRVNQHFTGHGNGDVYADWKYGNEFSIKTIKLEGSGYQTLNELERNTIATYNAFSSGYNKTRGNRG